jgi:hypothetical protein
MSLASPSSLTNLLAHPHLRLASTLEQNEPEPATEKTLPDLPRGQLHEFFLTTDHHCYPQWSAPLTLLLNLATNPISNSQFPFPSFPRLLFIGKPAWPSFQLLAAKIPLKNATFLDPATATERLWAIDQALRCRALAAIIADASELTPNHSRRLQLAAEFLAPNQGPLALLARPPWEKQTSSWAATRWDVRPQLNTQNKNPQWLLECFSCRRQHAGQDAPRRWIVDWSYQVLRGTTAFHLSPELGHRTPQTPVAPEPRAQSA